MICFGNRDERSCSVETPEGFPVSAKWGIVSMHGKGFFYTS